MRSALLAFRLLLVCTGGLLPGWLCAAPVEFNLPAQPAAAALLDFSQQAKVEVLFSFDELRAVTSTAVQGRHEPEDALSRLLRGTGFAARRNAAGKFVVTTGAPPAGSVRGRLVGPDGRGVPGARVRLITLPRGATSNRDGEFVLKPVPPGTYRLVATAPGYEPLQVNRVLVAEGREFALPPQTLRPAEELTQLEPFVVRDKSIRMKLLDDSAALLGPRRATGNLDLPRSENDALPYAIYTRDQITRSGVVALNEFLQRVILESDAATRPPEQSASFGPQDGFAGSSNLKLRGYSENETVVLINGRRLPEIQTSVTTTMPPDVNFVPLSLIQQVEVLPTSASALYTGNPVGGVINIVLRPDVTATEITTTYTNTARGYDAPQASVSLQHGQSLLGGALRLRFNALFASALPPSESELGLRRAHLATRSTVSDPLFGATPNVRSADGAPLFGPDSAGFTSVAPGADGHGGLAAFAGRAGVRSLDLFDSPGGMSASPNSADSPYGRRQRRAAYFASVTYDPLPWLQLGVDATHSLTVLNRGLDVLSAELTLPATSPANPFGRDVLVALNETAPLLGDNYSEGRIDFTSGVAGLLLRLPAEWRVSLDAQYARNVVKYRGLAGANPGRWQELVDQGAYHPLRDTQVSGPPAGFYQQALIFRGGRNRFVTLGDYDTLDAAVRVTNQSLALPFGRSAVVGGADYRRVHLADYREEALYADGTPAGDPAERTGRTLERYSFFGELQSPLLPVRLLPRWLRTLEADVAARFVASANANEVNIAPTFGLKADFAGGFSFRSSVTSSSRFPTPQFSKPVTAPSVPGSGLNQELIKDPRRNEEYPVQVDEAVDPGLPPEDAVTQTAGLIFERGREHRFRASLDFVDTRKTNEILALDAKAVVSVEPLFPDRVLRTAPAPDDSQAVGRIARVITGSVNASWRHSQNWTATLDYAWIGCGGGTLELRGRLLCYQRYDYQLFANSPVVDQLDRPDGTAALLRYRAAFNANWSNRRYGFGVDGQYFHSRILPLIEQAAQGSDHIKPYIQLDAYVQVDLGRWVPWKGKNHGLRTQIRVNNLSGFDYPKYTHEGSGTGVQPYGDWRGSTYSLSLTATF
ncbi:MAG: carboxypeptidase regulatory-like domain-containing protein [Opitutae bacterium]|nr:carboxypeptidase regulatory-like domain-containing protein [Opitutae bacterium]